MGYGIMAYASTMMPNGEVVIAESTEESIRSKDITGLLKFIMECWDADDERYKYVKVCWDLDEFTAPLFRLLSQADCQKLAGDNHKCRVQGFKLFYIRNKLLGITYGRDSVNVYGIKQYFGAEKEEPKTALEVAGYGDELMEALKRMGLNPSKLTSPVSIYEECVLSHMSIPTIYDMPDYKRTKEAAEYALQIMDREWRGCYQIGHWGDGRCFDYDIRACYPSIAKNLRNTRYCRYEKANHFVEGADWGVVRGKITVDTPVSPFVHYDGERNCMPIGTWEDYFTTEEIGWLYRHKAGTFQLYDGWFLTFSSSSLPFEAMLDRLFAFRKCGDIRERLAKGISVGIYGKFSQENDDGSYGKFFNPIYAAMITSRARLKVADFIYSHKLQEGLIAVMVDGVLAEKELAIPLNCGMGEWRLNLSSSALVISVGYQFLGDKRPHGIDYDTIMATIKAHPNQSYYKVNMRHRQTLSESLADGAVFGDLGRVKKYESSVDLLMIEPDRIFESLPKTGRQLLSRKYRSEPVRIGEAK